MEKKTWAKLIIAVILILALSLTLYLRWRIMERSTNWGQGQLLTSETAYYSKRIMTLIGNWWETALSADVEMSGRMKESYRTFLVIDMNDHAIWIEDHSLVREDYFTEFPAGLTWKLYHSTPQGNVELPVVRTVLKVRGLHSDRCPPEQFVLVGTCRRGYVSFNFNSHESGSQQGSNPFTLPACDFASSNQSEELYNPLLVTDSEYRQYRDFLRDSAQTLSTEKNHQGQIVPAYQRNMSNWQKVEKLLYMKIEKKVNQAGFDLNILEVQPGPDFSAGHVEIRANRGGFLRKLFGLAVSVRTFLNIDYLEDDVWYVKNAAHPQRTGKSISQLDLEFLVCPTYDITDSQRNDLLKKGRTVQQSMPAHASKWKATLPNGAVIELIGICENSRGEKRWWEPDGSELGYVPYESAESFGYPGENKKYYEIAWRVTWTVFRKGGIQVSTEGQVDSYSVLIRDKYGYEMGGELITARAYAFDKYRQKTTLKFGAKVIRGDLQYVTFKNISLVPGQDMGFSIEFEGQ